MINYFEETVLENSILPTTWQSQIALDELDVFLQSNWEQRSIFFDDEEVRSRQQFLSFLGKKGLRTNNYVGTIVFKGSQINIFPKVFRSKKEDDDTSSLDLKHMMNNIVQWISYCTKYSYPYININTTFDDITDLRDLFETLYVHYVKAALERGLYYQYEERVEEGQTIKGRIDFQDYVTRKIPIGRADLFRCTYSSFEFDNLLNQIIKSTCKLLIHQVSATNKAIIRNILVRLNEVSDVNCKPSDCDRIRLSYLNGNYRIILSLSKMFLLNQTSTYDLDTKQSFCFLFPTEYLFEGFIGGFIQSVLKGEARVKLQASELSLVDDIIYKDNSLGKAFTLKRDIVITHKEKGVFVLDTKYKMISRFEGNDELKKSITYDVSQADLYQVREYAAKQGLKDAYLLYPLLRGEEDESDFPVLRGTIWVESQEHTIDVHLVRLPFVFESDIEITKERLKKIIIDILG